MKRRELHFLRFLQMAQKISEQRDSARIIIERPEFNRLNLSLTG